MTRDDRQRFRTVEHVHPVPDQAPIWWSNAIFFCLVHIFAVFGMIWVSPVHKVSTVNLGLCWLYCQLGTFGVTIGYHRLWSHRSFVAIEPFRWFLAFAASFGFQGSARWWVLRHRLHHRFTDTEHDPYNAKRGLLFSHMGWIFRKPRYEKLRLVDRSDLDMDRVINFQHKYYLPISVLVGFVLPHLISAYVFRCNTHSAWDGIIYGGFVSRLVIWHLTFFINSLAHYIGDQLYDLDITARSNFLLAMFTCGEANHNYHHVFPKDYRNGPAPLDWDPTKWIIYVLYTYSPLVTKIHFTPKDEIEEARRRVLNLTKLTPTPSRDKVDSPRWFLSFEDLFRPYQDKGNREKTDPALSSPNTSSDEIGLTLALSSASESDSDRTDLVRRSITHGVFAAHSRDSPTNHLGHSDVHLPRRRSVPMWNRANIHQHIWEYLLHGADEEASYKDQVEIVRNRLRKLTLLLIDGYLVDVTSYAFRGEHPGGAKVLRQQSIIRPRQLPRSENLQTPDRYDVSGQTHKSENTSGRLGRSNSVKIPVGHVNGNLASHPLCKEDSWVAGYCVEWIDSSDAFHFQFNQHSWPAKQKMQQFRIARLNIE